VFVPFCVSLLFLVTYFPKVKGWRGSGSGSEDGLGGEDEFELGDDEPMVDDDVEARIQELENLSSFTEPTSEYSNLINRVHH
jgi:hypothetical protein